MLNKKPRIPAPVQIPEHLSFLQGYRDDLIAQTVSPHTRNAYLSDLKVKQSAVIHKVHRNQNGNDVQTDLVASRLETLGFVPGTKVQVITKGIFGGDPILIQIGFTRFALRKIEAEKVEIAMEGASA